MHDATIKIFVVSFTVDFSETDIKRLVVLAQCFPS